MKKVSGIRWLKTLQRILGITVLAHLCFLFFMSKVFTKNLVENYNGFLLPSLALCLFFLFLTHVIIQTRQNMATPRKGKTRRSRSAPGRPLASWEMR